MEVRAISKNVRMSASKGRDLARALVGKSVSEALAITEFSPRKAAFLIGKTIKSAAANAENNYGLNAMDMRIVKTVLDEGTRMRRYRPRARGSASPIVKQTCHITVVLSDDIY